MNVVCVVDVCTIHGLVLCVSEPGARALPDARTGDPSDTGMQQLSLANKRRGRMPCKVLTNLYLQMPQYKLL